MSNSIHNAVTQVRLEPAAPRSRVIHSTTDPLNGTLPHLRTECENLDLPNLLVVVSCSIAIA